MINYYENLGLIDWNYKTQLINIKIALTARET
jgi:hypothetical protein